MNFWSAEHLPTFSSTRRCGEELYLVRRFRDLAQDSVETHR